MSEKTSSSGAKAIFWWLIAGTVAYAVVLVFMAAQTEICPVVPNYLRSNWLLQLLDDYLRCRPLNELGDFLAGAFAPIAFIWLAGAVLIQSRELAAQREELRLSRDEAQQTREVMKQQAEESRAATSFIGEQTEILKKEQVQREKEQADREFDQLVRRFMVMRKSAPLLPVVGKRNPDRELVTLSQFQLEWAETENSKPIDDEIGFFRKLFSNTLRAQTDVASVAEGRVTIKGWKSHSFEIMIITLDRMISKQRELSSPHQIHSSNFMLPELKLALELLVAELHKFPKVQTLG